MKKFILLLTIMILPLGVNAMNVSDSFDVGDSVSVNLYDGYQNEDPNGIGFHVLRASAAGEQNVLLIYDGLIDGSPDYYDQTIPGSNGVDEHTATVVLEEAHIGTVINKVVNKAGAKWNIVGGSASLLQKSDLEYLGIQQNAGVYEIPAKYEFLAPRILNGVEVDTSNYWTSIQGDTESTVYYVKYNSNRTSLEDAWATLEPVDLSSVITGGEKHGIRPVVFVDKEYILCNNTKNPTTSTTPALSTNPTEPVSPKTGVEDYILPLGIVALVASAIAVYTKKKNVFNQI